VANEGAEWLRGRWAAKLVVHLFAFSILGNLCVVQFHSMYEYLYILHTTCIKNTCTSTKES
jgi:hypothetical protein